MSVLDGLIDRKKHWKDDDREKDHGRDKHDRHDKHDRDHDDKDGYGHKARWDDHDKHDKHDKDDHGRDKHGRHDCDDDGKEHKARWDDDKHDGKDGRHGDEEGKFCWKDDWKDGDHGKKWDAKNDDDCGCGDNQAGNGGGEMGDLHAALVHLSDAIDVVNVAIGHLDSTPSNDAAHVDSFDNDSMAA